MKLTLTAVFLIALVGTAVAEAGMAAKFRARVADASSDACLASCSSENASCKRVCPTTFSTPCVSSCDSQYQTCRQGCQNK
jgi:hypothetical protein